MKHSATDQVSCNTLTGESSYHDHISRSCACEAWNIPRILELRCDRRAIIWQPITPIAGECVTGANIVATLCVPTSSTVGIEVQGP